MNPTVRTRRANGPGSGSTTEPCDSPKPAPNGAGWRRTLPTGSVPRSVRALRALSMLDRPAVPGLAAKPILDLAAGVNGVSIEAVRDPLEGLGYEYRGDAGDRGGLVFVLEDRPRHRVAHVHVVEHGGPQWQRYLAFRDVLRLDASARTAYERMKTELAREFADDRKAYSAAKEGIVRKLLEQHDRHQTE